MITHNLGAMELHVSEHCPDDNILRPIPGLAWKYVCHPNVYERLKKEIDAGIAPTVKVLGGSRDVLTKLLEEKR